MKAGGKFLSSLRSEPSNPPYATRAVDQTRFVPLRPPLKQKREVEIKAATGMDINLIQTVEITWSLSDFAVK